MKSEKIKQALFVIASFVTCFCYQDNKFSKEPSFSDKICTEDEVEFETSTRSVISCGGLCTVDAGCQSIVYHKVNKLCYGITPAISCHTFLDLPGAAFYRLFPLPTTTATTTTTTTTTPIGCASSVALLPEVGHSALSASGVWNYNYRAFYGRLDYYSNWASDTNNDDEYIQGNLPNSIEFVGRQRYTELPLYNVPLNNDSLLTKSLATAVRTTDIQIRVDFNGLRVVTDVILQGPVFGNDLVTSYKLLTSTDCSTFTAFVDGDNNPQVFPGAIDRTSHVRSTLRHAVIARCFRINPVARNWPSLRFELMGCHP